MLLLQDLAWFFGGATLTNAVPHLAAGLMGRAFQSPFASPRGEGLSSSTVNVLWGFANLAMAYGLLCHVGDFNPRQPLDMVVSGLGGLAIGLYLARHFGRFHGGDLR